MAGEQWILVAGPAHARLFRRLPGHALQELEAFRPPAPSATRRPPARIGEPSRMRERHLRFAGILASRLKAGLQQDQCHDITLVAACPFLGALRRSLPPSTRRAVKAMVPIDLCDADDRDILDAIAGHPDTEAP